MGKKVDEFGWNPDKNQKIFGLEWYAKKIRLRWMDCFRLLLGSSIGFSHRIWLLFMSTALSLDDLKDSGGYWIRDWANYYFKRILGWTDHWTILLRVKGVGLFICSNLLGNTDLNFGPYKLCFFFLFNFGLLMIIELIFIGFLFMCRADGREN